MVPFRVYLAGSLRRRDQLLSFAATMPKGCMLRASWLSLGEKDDAVLHHPELAAWAEIDLREVSTADLFVTWREDGPVRGGHLVEMGIALGRGIPVLVVGHCRVVFDHLPGLEVVSSEAEALWWLKQRVSQRKSLLSKLR